MGGGIYFGKSRRVSSFGGSAWASWTRKRTVFHRFRCISLDYYEKSEKIALKSHGIRCFHTFTL